MKPLATWTWRAVRLAIGVGIAAWIIRQVDMEALSRDTGNWRRNWPLWMLAAEALYLAVYGLGIARWRLLMRSQAITIPFHRAFTLFFIGHFFNAFMLGAAGGDLVKAWAVARETHHRKTEAATLVFLDRLLGLAALVLLVLAVLAIRAPMLKGSGPIRTSAVFLGALMGGMALAVFALFRRNWLQSRAWRAHSVWPWLPPALPAQVERVYAAADRLRHRPDLLGRAFAFSLGIHLLSLLANYLFAVAIASGLSPMQALTLYPLVGALGALPLTPGGLGVREGAAVLLALLPYLGITLWSLFGGLLYLLEPWRAPRPAS